MSFIKYLKENLYTEGGMDEYFNDPENQEANDIYKQANQWLDKYEDIPDDATANPEDLKQMQELVDNFKLKMKNKWEEIQGKYSDDRENWLKMREEYRPWKFLQDYFIPMIEGKIEKLTSTPEERKAQRATSASLNQWARSGGTWD